MNVVGYVRLSRDEDKENYSSIIEQKRIIEEYAINRGWSINNIYVDDNYTGYNFNRPSYIEMMKELEAGKIDVVIAKDLSRIGRNNGKVLVLIDRFKELNRNLILVNEGNNGLDILNDDQDILGIKTWYNEMYVKDISRKVRASMHSKQKSGDLIMGNYYGYKKININNKFELIVDEEIKPIIQYIFKLYNQGLGYKKICDILQEKGYITPSEYIRKKHEERGRVFKNTVTNIWQTHMIQRIVANDVYIGTLTTKKKRARLIKGRPEPISKEEQYKFYNHHEAIISPEEFKMAQDIIDRKKLYNYRNKSKYNYIFSGFIRCADCGYIGVGLNLGNSTRIKRGYDCTMYRKYGTKHCTTHAISEEELLVYFKNYIKKIKYIYEEYIKNVNIEEKKKNLSTNVTTIKKQLEITNQELKLLLNQKIKDILKETNVEYRQIIEESYTQLENEKKKTISDLTNKLSQVEEIQSNTNINEITNTIDIFNKLIESDIPENQILEMVLDKILLNRDRSVTFKLKLYIENILENIQ